MRIVKKVVMVERDGGEEVAGGAGSGERETRRDRISSGSESHMVTLYECFGQRLEPRDSGACNTRQRKFIFF